MSSAPPAVRREILVIDDDAAIQRSIMRQLQGSAFLNVDFESDGYKGLRRLNEKDYSLVLCDVKMKPASGLEILAKIKATHPSLPVIMLTGLVDDQIIETAQRLGSSAFLIKPIRKTRLIETISRVLGIAQVFPGQIGDAEPLG